MATPQDSLAYQEPGITTILIQSCFLLALNLVNHVLDKIIYCGLIGQLLVGMAWGAPGASWLQLDVQKSIQQLGYLGLLLLVYEGGLSTSFSQLKSNIGLSALVALTGVAVPMGLSFTMIRIVDASPFQAFAAGASLCSTSIGTTFTILSTTGLAKTRIGVVLGSAAMMDDVAGLVMVQIISNLGSGNAESSFDATIVIRPILVAFGFALGLGLLCRYVVAVAVQKINASTTRLPPSIMSMQFAFIAHMCILIGLVTGAEYAGTSGLFAAYLAGACISWFDETLATLKSSPRTEPTGDGATNQEAHVMVELQPSSTTHTDSHQPRQDHARSNQSMSDRRGPTGEQAFEKFCKEPLKRILSPLFFASIGFSIPITKMFQGRVIWRGIVFTLLMILGKTVTGIYLIRFSLAPPSIFMKLGSKCRASLRFCSFQPRENRPQSRRSVQTHPNPERRERSGTASGRRESRRSSAQTTQTSHTPAANAGDQSSRGSRNPSVSCVSRTQSSLKPRSLYPASILGMAMVARGEIGFLIVSVAESGGIFARSSSSAVGDDEASEMYLVIIWAICLCTIIGPICVGTLVKRVKAMQRLRENSGGEDPLGVWGVS